MKTAAATLTLIVMFLSAGAFAGAAQQVARPAVAFNANMTVIEKNQNWPVLIESPANACAQVRCFDI